ncbi:MAG: hypothetical protein JNM36_03745 [Chitinophagales bacterium]|nr:hypothetical protein [Chitinophagales bacterium]
MKNLSKLLIVIFLCILSQYSNAQSKINVQTLQPLPTLQFKEIVVKFSEIPEIADFKQLLRVKNLADIQGGENAIMLEIMDKLINYNAGKLYNDGVISWVLPKEAVVLQHNPNLDSNVIKTQFLQVVTQSYQTVEQLYKQGKTPQQIKQYLLDTLK